jgi:hypothetical protein
VRRALAALAATCVAGCGAGGGDHDRPLPRSAPGVGPDARWRPPSLSPAAEKARPIDGLRCSRSPRRRFGVHLELFAARRVVIVAPGIGVAPPRIREGAYVRDGRCSYPVRTREPTGVIEVERGRALRLGDLFAVWGQRLSRRRLASFRGPVKAFVGGRPRRGDPRVIPLARHAQIVLEVGGHVPPHARYRFPPGL